MVNIWSVCLVGAVGSASVSKSEGREFDPHTGHLFWDTFALNYLQSYTSICQCFFSLSMHQYDDMKVEFDSNVVHLRKAV